MPCETGSTCCRSCGSQPLCQRFGVASGGNAEAEAGELAVTGRPQIARALVVDERLRCRAVVSPVRFVLRADFGEVERERRVPARQAVGVGDTRIDRSEPPVGGQSGHRHEAGDRECRSARLQSGGGVPEIELEGGGVADLRVQLARRPVVQDDRVRAQPPHGKRRTQIGNPRFRASRYGGQASFGALERRERAQVDSADQGIRHFPIAHPDRIRQVGEYRHRGLTQLSRAVVRRLLERVADHAAGALDDHGGPSRHHAHADAQIVERQAGSERPRRVGLGDLAGDQHGVDLPADRKIALQP